ncbi:SDR family oxidoreductase [Paenibacillus xylanilyticus]|uniref:SDR family oxidoreductase n=1 Tax=Paenibacillus xylanilyticus TaxID=248903 RepID=UPI0039A1526A
MPKHHLPGHDRHQHFRIPAAIGSSEEIQFPFEIPEHGIPLTRKPGKPEDVASLLLYLASGQARHITGTEVFVDGAETLIKG